ncbi:MAG: hypothetical protein ABI388_09750 [Bacteroidia bacterium]
MYRVVTSAFADADMLAAAQWYEMQEVGLGNKFLDDVEALFAYLESNPLLFRKIAVTVYQAPLKKFPYVVLYKIKGKMVHIAAVFNCYQNPSKKG